MSDNNVDDPQKDKSWLQSEIYNRYHAARTPRTSLFKFGTPQDLLTNVGKLAGQGFISFVLFWILAILLVPGPAEWGGDQIYLAVAEIVKLVCFTISVFLMIRVADDSYIEDLGLKINPKTLADFLFGFGIVLSLFLIEFFVYWILGWIKIEHVAWETRSFSNILWNILAVLLIFTFTGWSEEILSRGYHLRIISKGLNRPLGILLSSIYFSYLHRNNPDITPFGLFFIFLFGLVMCSAFLSSYQLWLAMGIHAGWDFCVAILWGTPISGLKIFHLFDFTISHYSGLFEILELIIIAVAIRLYTSKRPKDTRDW